MHSETYKLHSAARRYCMDQFSHWSALYEQIARNHGVNYTQASYNTFPRYSLLCIILNEVEKIDADHLPGFEELGSRLVEAGRLASRWPIDTPANETARLAIEDEREKFCTYIESLTPDSISFVEPLPYRRTLIPAEVESLWRRIEKRWGTSGRSYWYPFGEKTEPTLAVFDSTAFEKHISHRQLRAVGLSLGFSRLYELREFGEGNCIMAIDLWQPRYARDGEGFWVSDNLEWIMYASHESTITVGGRLNDEVRALSSKLEELEGF
jgi:hypothetical protein